MVCCDEAPFECIVVSVLLCKVTGNEHYNNDGLYEMLPKYSL